MLTPLDWILFALTVVGLALRAWFGMRTLKRLAPAELERARPRLWARAIASQWTLVALLVALWMARGRAFADLGIVPRFTWGLGGVLVGIAIVVLLRRGQVARFAGRPESLARLRARLAPVRALLPSSRAQWPGFFVLCVTAGVCEELLFRGFVTWVLAHFVAPFVLVAIAQAALFGLAHAYQGPRNVLLTGTVGLVMSGLVWVSGGLWAAMLVHALMDLNAGDLAVRVAALPGAGDGAA